MKSFFTFIMLIMLGCVVYAIGSQDMALMIGITATVVMIVAFIKMLK